MTRTKTLRGRTFALGLFGSLSLCLTAGGASLQDPQNNPHQETPPEVLNGEAGQDDEEVELLNPFRTEAQGEPSAQDEMIRLFQEVETSMNRMGTLLFDASKGETSALAEFGASGMDEIPTQPDSSGGGGGKGALADLLRASSSEGAAVLEGIDQILEIAKNQGGGT